LGIFEREVAAVAAARTLAKAGFGRQEAFSL